MINGKRTIKWRSTFQESLVEYLSHSLSEYEKDIFNIFEINPIANALERFTN